MPNSQDQKPDIEVGTGVWPAQRIRNFIRAQTHPYPGAFTIIDGKKVTIWKASIEEE